jgi:DNA-binding CsgD family transcriptional regulator
LRTDDYRRLLAVLEDVERPTSVSAFRRTALDALERELGYQSAIFLTGSTDEAKIEGFISGYPQRRLDAQLARLSNANVVGAAVLSALDRSQPIELPALLARLDGAGRGLLTDFLESQGISHVLGVWLDTGGTTQGLLCLLSSSRPFSSVDRERLSALAPHLANLLSHQQPRHVKLAASPLLTPREAETVDLVAAGYSNRLIARRLNVTESTVKKHVSAALTKLGVTSRTQLTLAWLGGEASGRRASRRAR